MHKRPIFPQKSYYSHRKKKKQRKRRLLRMFITILICVSIGGGIRFRQEVIKELPAFSKIEDFAHFAQSSTIYDKNGEKLYTLFEENRKYVSYQEISPNIINAAIATEDDTFWTNAGLDYRGILKATVNYGLYKVGLSSNIRGASTITQQTIKNLLLDNRRTPKRKLKERVLTKRLDKVTEKDVKAKYNNLSKDEIERKKKELIMEIYLNMVFLGNNSYGVEAASNKYFAKSASELSIMEGAVLAGIIQAPGRYDVYDNRKGEIDCQSSYCQGAIGGLVLIPAQGDDIHTGAMEYATHIFSGKILPLDLKNSRENEKFLELLQGKSTNITYKGELYTMKYLRGRKDTVLRRLYEEKYISQEEFKKAIIEGITLTLQSKAIDINAPHFVFWVKDYILSHPTFQEAGITEDMLMKGGLQIHTTLDYKVQRIAKKTLYKHKKLANQYGANNRAFLYMDSTNGDVIAYVGSLDYNNKKIEGKNDMVREPRQPGSSIKPLVYALGFQTIPLTLDTPIFDIPFNVGQNTIHNFDGKYFGLMPLRKALAASRNVPAVKMFFALGREEKLKPFLQDLGMTSLKNDREYGYSLSLGAGEVPMLELGQAYAHLSTLGKPAKINPIQKITGPDGKILYQKEITFMARILQKGPAYLLWSILSNDANMPAGRPAAIRVYGFKNGTKSGTSNMEDEQGRSKSRDAWLILYTPSKVALSWAGNTDASPMDGYGGKLNAPVLKDFFKKLKDEGYIVQEDHVPTEISSVMINKITNRIPTESTPTPFIVPTKGYNKTLPSQGDIPIQTIQYDTLCNGAVSDFTPPSDIAPGYVLSAPISFMPNNMDIADITKRRNNSISIGTGGTGGQQEDVSYQYNNVFLDTPTKPCEQRIPKEDLDIKVGITQQSIFPGMPGEIFTIKYSLSAQRYPLKSIKIFIDGAPVATEPIQSSKRLSLGTLEFTTPQNISLEGVHTLTIMAIDTQGFENHKDITFSFGNDETPPTLDTDTITIEPQQDGTYQVTLVFVDEGVGIAKGTIVVDKDTIIAFQEDSVSFSVKSVEKIIYSIEDKIGNTTKEVIDLREYQ